MPFTATADRLFATPQRRGTLFDVAIAAATFAGSLLLISHGGIPDPASEADLDPLGVAVAACASAPLIAWRRSPIGIFAASTAASALLAGLGYPLGFPLAAVAALYLLTASRSDEDPWTRRTTTTVLALVAAYVAAAEAGHGGVFGVEALHSGLAFAIGWFAGERTRLRREHIAELHERAVSAERDAERERLLAVAEERARIARDLHDSAGHSINLITVRAGAARLRQDPERSQSALEVIEEIGRQTAAEIDGIVDSLRDPGEAEGAEDAPLGLASLDALIARHTAVGLDVGLSRTGDPRELESAVDQAAYRILQEALTNAGRHGAGAAQVELAFEDAALELAISNATTGETAPRLNGGHGLIGMRERATLLGGSFDAERANGDFRVRARLPYGGPSK